MYAIRSYYAAYPYRGGLAAYNERLAREFISLGHTVNIETFSLQYPGILFPGKSQYIDGPAPSGLSIKRTVITSYSIHYTKLYDSGGKELLNRKLLFHFQFAGG